LRNLASIQKIVNISPIPGADRIEKVQVLGWECVSQKNEFKINDLVVYVEVDSILPEKPEFEFLRIRKFRIKTIKLKQQISQGICFPLSILPEGNYNEGDDVTNIIGVIKYESLSEKEENIIEKYKKSKNPIIKFLMKYKWFRNFINNKKDKGWPDFIPHTDEIRIQNIPNIINDNKTYYATEKIDGQSSSFGLKKLTKKWYHFKQPYKFFVCGRKVCFRTPIKNNYWTVAKQFDIENVLHSLIGDNQNVYIQGEIAGVKIQKNKYKIKGLDFYAYNYATSDDGKLPYDEMWLDLTCNYQIKCVPLVLNSFKLPSTILECVELSKGKS
jgi:hypothetical protein